LFGAALALDSTTLWLAGSAAVISIIGMALIFRPLMLDTIDPIYLKTSGGNKVASHLARAAFFALLAITSVASFHALGALMSVGLTILPAIAARYLARDIVPMMLAAGLVGALGVMSGLLASYHFDAPAGAAIVLSLVVLAFSAAILGPVNSVLFRSRNQKPDVQTHPPVSAS
jgi:zinc/manganese transport system permease protein